MRIFLFFIVMFFLCSCSRQKCSGLDMVGAMKEDRSLAYIVGTKYFDAPGSCTGFSPIWYAQKADRYDVVDALLESGWSYYEKEVGKISPELVWEGYLDGHVSVQAVLKAPRRDDDGDNALLNACKHGELEKVEALLELFPPSSTNKHAKNCAHIVSGRSDLDESLAEGYVSLLSEFGVNFDQIDINGNTVLGAAVESLNGKSPAASKAFARNFSVRIVSSNLVNVNAYGKGAPPIVHALLARDVGLADFLMDNGALVSATFCDDFEVRCSAALQELPGIDEFLKERL